MNGRRIVRVVLDDNEEEEEELLPSLSCPERASYHITRSKRPLDAETANDIVDNEKYGGTGYLPNLYPVPEAVQLMVHNFWVQTFLKTLSNTKNVMLEVLKRRWPLYHDGEFPTDDILSAYSKYLVDPIIDAMRQNIEQKEDYRYFYITLELLQYLFTEALADSCLTREDTVYILKMLQHYSFDKRKIASWYESTERQKRLPDTFMRRWYSTQTYKSLVTFGKNLKSPCNQELYYKTKEFTDALRRLLYLKILLVRMTPLEDTASYEKEFVSSLDQLSSEPPWGAFQLLVFRRRGKDYYRRLINASTLPCSVVESIMDNLELFTVPFRYDSIRRSFDVKTVRAGDSGETFAVTSMEIDPTTEIKHDILTTLFLPVTQDYSALSISRKIRQLGDVLSGWSRSKQLQKSLVTHSVLSCELVSWNGSPSSGRPSPNNSTKRLLESAMARSYTMSLRPMKIAKQQQSVVSYPSLLNKIVTQINNASVDRATLKQFIAAWFNHVKYHAPLPMNATVTASMRRHVFSRLKSIISRLAAQLWKFSGGYRLVLYPELTPLYIALVFLRWQLVQRLLTVQEKKFVEDLWTDFERAAIVFESDPRSCTITAGSLDSAHTGIQNLVRIQKNTEKLIKLSHKDIKSLAQK